jgi:nuclear GTP-binding protein
MNRDDDAMDVEGDLPRKRPRSPSVSLDGPPRKADDETTRLPKRLRGSGESYRAHQNMAVHNPLNRRMQKKEAKKARRAHRVGLRDVGGKMEIDEGLEFTFMT